jgi:hypothetical protein
VELSGKITIHKLIKDKLVIDNINCSYIMSRNIISIPSFTAKIFGGDIAGRSIITLAPENPQINLVATFNAIRLQNISSYVEKYENRLFGNASGQLQVAIVPKEPLLDRIIGKIEFTIDNVMAFPQCYAAVAEQLSNMNGECLIVDVGSWTIDIMSVRNGVPIESKCETFTESMISVIQDIKSRTSELYGKELSESKITEYIHNPQVTIPDKYRKLMDEAFKRFADRVEGILKENGHDTELSDVIYVGGGATIMKNYGKQSNNISYIEDVRANAIGYELLARKMG